ncbi:MAG TPA: hypothetical protein VJ183_19610 [Chloroflexia bacterium]|nr:hypothetical protein [Chloroflexia bacterium]
MQSEAKRPVGKTHTYAPRNTFWAHFKAAIGHNRNLGDKVLWCLGADWQRTRHKFEGFKPLDKLFHAVLCWEWWAVAQYRFAYWVHKRGFPELGRRRFIRKLLFLQQAALLRFCYFTGKIIEGLSGARLSGEAEIGPGLLLMHTGSCGIGRGASIGCNFTMHQDANIVAGNDFGYATIGDNVTLYSGARIIGAMHIGNRARVGANAVVIHDLPADCLALGAPARPIQPGERPAPYPASRQMRDFLSTLILSGELEKVGQHRYRDVSTGEIITFDYEGAEEAGQQ